MAKSPSETRSRRRAPRLMAGLTGLCIVGLLVSWWHLVSGDSEIAIPEPVMPSPNAFDYYVAAGKAVTAATLFDSINSPKTVIPLTLAQKEAVIQQNATALQSLHQGFTHEYRHPPLRSNLTSIGYRSAFRDLARLLLAQSHVGVEQGDWGGAADSALDAIRMGADIPRGGPLLLENIGLMCQTIGQKPMWDIVDHLDATQSCAVTTRLTDILERRVPYVDTLQEEKWTGQATLQEMFRSVTPRTALSTASPWIGADAPRSERYWTAFSLLCNRKGILHSYTTYMDTLMAQARRPYAAKVPPPFPFDFFSKSSDLFAASKRFQDVSVEAKLDLLLITLALHLYQLEHGHAPSALTELTPAYLQKLPNDPFALQGTFKYLPKGKSYVLYSIGPDGKDDGGTPIYDVKYSAASKAFARYLIREESVGDIVAGISTP